MEALVKHGTLAVEMEAAGLYAVADLEGKQALAICTFSDLLFRDASLPAAERELLFDRSVALGLAAFATACAPLPRRPGAPSVSASPPRGSPWPCRRPGRPWRPCRRCPCEPPVVVLAVCTRRDRGAPVACHAKGFRSIGSIRVRSGNSCSRPRLSRRVGATRRRFGRTVEGEPRHGEANGGSHRVKTPGEVADE